MIEISISQAQGRVPVTVMQLKGDLDAVGADIFEVRAQEVVLGGAKDVLIDMSEVPFMSSAGIRSIHGLFNSLHPQGSDDYKRILEEGVRQGIYKAPHMKLFNPTTRVKEMLEMVGIDMYMDILVGDKIKAIDTFNSANGRTPAT